MILAGLASCKNNGGGTAAGQASEKKAEKPIITAKDIIVGADRKPVKPDFQVLDMSVNGDLLKVIFRYSGGCEEHDFDAHFSGGWLKSLPPQAVLDFEHLNPNNDACRSLVKDSVVYNLSALRYPGNDKVIIKWSQDKKLEAVYEYGK